MAGTRKRAAAAAQDAPVSAPPVEVAPDSDVEPNAEENDVNEVDEEDEDLPALRFRHALTWKAGRAIDVGELMERLSALHKELATYEHGGLKLSTLLPVAQELANHQLLGHRDRGVQACLAVCIVDVFRLFAPHAPYKEKQLRDIFTMIIDSIVPALARRQDPYHEFHLVVLKAIYEYELFAILTDFSSIDGLVTRLYMKVFDMFASVPTKDSPDDGPSQTVYVNLQESLTGLAMSYENLPGGVVDIILAQFLRVDPSVFQQSVASSDHDHDHDHTLKRIPLSYNMAQSICNGAAETMTRAVSHYFSAIIIDASEPNPSASTRTTKSTGKRRRGSDDVLDDHVASGPSAELLEELRKAHSLLRELWRSCPLILQSVVLQVNAELSAENIDIRAIATETVGDMVAGIGAAGPPPAAVLDPAAYPSVAVEPARARNSSFFATPSAIHPFSTVHPSIYRTFMTRKQDKAPQVRMVFATSIGRILSTSAGGLGLDHDEEQALLDGLAELLLDRDDKVRLAAVRAVAYCNYDTIVQKIGKHNGLDAHGSVLYNLADRIRDPRHSVRAEAIRLLGQLWGVASGAIAEGSERQHELFGPIPSKILEALYINEPGLTNTILQTLYTCLLPINFPPHRSKSKEPQTGRSLQRSQRRQDAAESHFDPDTVRAERLLLLANDLTEKAKTVFFALQRQQVVQARYLSDFLNKCEAYNATRKDSDAKETKAVLNKYVTFLAKPLPDPIGAADHIWKFIKNNNHRLYHLMRFSMSPERGHQEIGRAIKELSSKIMAQGKGNADMLATMVAILYKSSLLVYNKSHVPTVTEYARNDEKGLGSIAHEVLKEILDNHPEVLEAHVRTICQAVVKDVPDSGQTISDSTVKSLKACASFAQRDPGAMPDDRAFLQAMVKFALQGRPQKAAKHAITVIVSIKKKKDMYVRDIVKQCTDSFAYGAEGFLSKLASLSQLMLLAASDIDDCNEVIETIAIRDVLLRTNSANVKSDETQWHDEIDDDCMAKILALKILANRLRFFAEATSDAQVEESVKEMADKVYQMLIKLLKDDGELSADGTTPAPHRAWLRLTAAVLLLKLSCASKVLEQCLKPMAFQHLALVAQDPLPEVRSKFFRALRKYLGQGRLPARFYAIPFLAAFEPSRDLKNATTSWLRARASTLAKAGESTMELTLGRFISLLVHHPDFSMEPTDLEEFPRYILFYLQAVATKSNIPLIYHVAQRIKSVQDGLDHDANTGLYCLSEIAQAAIREYAELHNWQLPAWNGKLRMPAGIFEQLPSHSRAQEIADKQFAPPELLERMDEVVRGAIRSGKRKADSGGQNGPSKKRAKTNVVRTKTERGPTGSSVKTPRGKRAIEDLDQSARRRSSRTSKARSYADLENSEEEEEEVEEEEDVRSDEQAEDEDEEMKDASVTSEGNEKQRALRQQAKSVNGVEDDEDDELSPPPSDSDAAEDEERVGGEAEEDEDESVTSEKPRANANTDRIASASRSARGTRRSRGEPPTDPSKPTEKSKRVNGTRDEDKSEKKTNGGSPESNGTEKVRPVRAIKTGGRRQKG